MRVTTAILALLLVQPPAMATRSLHEIPHTPIIGSGQEVNEPEPPNDKQKTPYSGLRGSRGTEGSARAAAPAGSNIDIALQNFCKMDHTSHSMRLLMMTICSEHMEEEEEDDSNSLLGVLFLDY